MPYSLVSAATLGFDLVRLPAGRSVAEVLLVGLAADAGGPRPHRRRPSRPRAGARAARRARRPLPPGPRDGRRRPARPRRRRAAAETAPPSSSPSSSRAPSATPRPSNGCSATTSSAASTPPPAPLDPDVLAEAADVLADAAVGLLGGRRAAAAGPPRADRRLRPRHRRGLPSGASGADLGRRSCRRSSTSVRDLDDAGRARWRAAVDEGRAEHRPWAGAMHEASLGRARLRPHPGPGGRPAARRPGVPRRRLRRPRRRRRRLERRRRVRPGPGHGRPARRGLARRAARSLAPGDRPLADRARRPLRAVRRRAAVDRAAAIPE